MHMSLSALFTGLCAGVSAAPCALVVCGPSVVVWEPGVVPALEEPGAVPTLELKKSGNSTNHRHAKDFLAMRGVC